MDINMKKQAIKELLMKYTDPKPEYDGMTADELARLILIAINDPEEWHKEADKILEF